MADLESLILEGEYQISLRGVSYQAVKAGDLVSFDYEDGTSRWGLVVKSKRSGIKGHFTSTKDNLLLNIFQLDSVTPAMMDLIVNNLYRDRLRCTYQNVPRLLSVFIGKDNFRTFNIARINRLISIGIKK